MADLLLTYEAYLKTEKRASDNTISSYMRDVHQFSDAMLSRDVELTEVLIQDVEEYIASLNRRGKSPATVTRSVASLKSFYQCLFEKGLVTGNPAKGITPVKVERKLV